MLDPQAAEAANEKISNIAAFGAAALTFLGGGWAFVRGMKKKPSPAINGSFCP